MNDILFIEELAANAVPAAVVQEFDGWRLRFNWGVTRRANSVLALRAGSLSLAAKIAVAEDFYRRRNIPCRFQLNQASAPADLDATLAERGYMASAPTFVQVAPLEVLLGGAPGSATVSEQFDEDWLAAYVAGEGETNSVKIGVRREMLQRVGPQAGFAAASVDGALAAVAFGVVERGWLGIFSVATVPSYRRRGLARHTLGELARWAQRYGAAQCYLQVFSTNAPAVALYAGLDFRTMYEYWYRER
jgi:ribosomal protein S18 acetylase RimI-like enzyme